MAQALTNSNLEKVILARVSGGTDQKESYLIDRRMVPLGLNGLILTRLIKHIPRKVLAATVGTNVTNLSKYYSRHLNAQQTDQLNDLSILWSELRVFFNDDKKLLLDWLESSVPALSWDRPFDILSSIAGRKDIYKLLSAMRSGDFA